MHRTMKITITTAMIITKICHSFTVVSVVVDASVSAIFRITSEIEKKIR